MRPTHVILLLWLTICRCAAADLPASLWGPENHNVRMSISSKTGGTAIKLNDPVVLTIALTNVSTDERLAKMFQTALDTEYEEGYSFLIISPSGKHLSAKAPNQQGRIPGNQDLAAHAPGYPLTLHLSKLCKFDEVGTYTVTATGDIRMPNDLQTRLTVVSNPLTITMVTDK